MNVRSFYSKLILSIFGVSLLSTSYSQSIVAPNKIIPASPEVAILQKQVKIPVETSTGIPNISIPLFDLKSGNISVPISLSYYAGGIRSTQLASSTGLGWGLMAGGVIQRSIRGWVDNNNTFAITQHYVDSMNDKLNWVYTQDALKSYTDFSQDDYSYNFPGYSGSFYFDSVGKIHTVYGDQLDIKTVIDSPSYFRAKDYNGNSYMFDKWDMSSMRSYASNELIMPPPTSGISAWRLTKIKNQTLDSILFNYSVYNISYYQRTADIYDYFVPHSFTCQVCWYPQCEGDCGDSIPTTVYHNMTSHVQNSPLVTEIISRDTKIIFHYSDDSTASIWQRRLDSIIVQSLPDSAIKLKYHLIYGLFSGNNQLKLVALRRVNVLTQEFEETKFEYFETVPLPDLDSRSIDMFGFFNGKSNTFLITTSDPEYTYPNADRTIDSTMIVMGTLKRINYPTGGFTEFRFEPNRIDSNTYGPGIRVKEVVEYDGINAKGFRRTAYEYYGYLGEKLDFPIDMRPEVRHATYTHKAYSSVGSASNYLISSPVVPQGYGYDSVVIRKKGSDYDLMTTEKYDVLALYNTFRAFPTETNIYKYGTSGYEIEQKRTTSYNRHILTQYPAVVAEAASAIPQNNATLYYDAENHDCWSCVAISAGLSTYSLAQNIMLKQKEKSIQYTSSGSIVDSVLYYYDDIERMLPTRIVKANSIDSTITVIKYPEEMVDSSLDPTGVYQVMLDSSIIAPQIITETFNAQGNPLTKIITSYASGLNVGSSLYIAPESYKVGNNGSTPVLKQKINSYDQVGNILEYEDIGSKSSFLWDYKRMYPIAKIDNAGVSEVAYSSFEAQETAGWTLNGGSYSTTNAITGLKGYTLSSSDSITAPGKTGQFTVSYWSRNGSFTVNGNTGTAGSAKNGWTYYQHTVTTSNGIRLTGTGTLDELRLYPVSAQMSTYALNPLIGEIATCGIDNRVKYYEYDGLNRLIRIRDADSNILKRVSYYTKQSGYTGMYYNTTISDWYQRNNCGSGYEGSYLQYIVPAGRYSSTISQADADLQAEKELTTLGQLYANLYGRCWVICVPSCPTPTKKCIDGTCVRGILVYVSSVYNPLTGKYDCQAHYEFIDGTWSADFLEESDNPCL